MKEIIVNDSNDKRIITVVEDGELIEKYEEDEELHRLEGNIYLGKVTDILVGMQAAFVDIGDDKNAFLHLKDLLPKASNETGNKELDLNQYNIKDYVKVGMPIMVQVKKDKTEKKGAKVSTHLNIAGKFVVLIPNSKFITISQKIEEETEIKRLTEIVENINIKDYGIIIRTSAINASQEEIKNDIDDVIGIYNNIINDFKNEQKNKNVNVKLLFEKGDIIKRLLLDIGNQNIDNIIVNNKETFNYIKELLVINNLDINLKLIEKDNILDIYGLEEQIEKLSKRLVWLNCGGFITIDKTEALTAIDVNTGKFTGKENIEKTVLKVNSEATIEIVKQLRTRNLGGIFIIDYIDMDNKEDEKTIQELLIQNLKKDRAKTQVCGFTKLHLLEMTRKQIF